ncbi:MAG: hypothetical protein OQL28_06375 [Sedimenticola sp.]|nr:hypothetical protein [Sedimenticola sp.]
MLSALALWHIREAWLSLYPLSGEPRPALPLPTNLALQLSAPLPFALLAIMAAAAAGTARHHRLLLITSFGWFAIFLFLNWALALPFIRVETNL